NRCGGLTHASLLIGNSDDFGWHPAGLIQGPNLFKPWGTLGQNSIYKSSTLSLDFIPVKRHRTVMKLILSTHNVTITKAIEDHIVSRIEKLAHLNRFAVNARVTLEHDKTKA